ncbi:hypothetical protein [Noviherbaspirillum aerium]|uniref:hypothetical protein n=1 Tax=Noviherbaspirillum aerium TaxID=2588497 RepID=UPI001CEF7F10|nr:hypothetical protein [Noviherbaspirillum aerium]
MLSFKPGAELLEGEIVDGIDLVNEHLFEAGQFELPVAALYAGRLFAEAASSGTGARHIGLTKMPCHHSLRFTVRDILTSWFYCRFTTFNGAAQHENALESVVG